MFFDVMILDEMNFCSLHEVNPEITSGDPEIRANTCALRGPLKKP
jgi:hypothetical protein